MNFYLIRHTKVAVPEGLCYGKSEVPLATTFACEAQVIKHALDNQSFGAVYSSPLSRTLKLADYCGYKAAVDKRLQELDFGDWEGRLWEDIYLEANDWFQDWVNQAPPHGESFLDLRSRALDFLEDLILHNHSSTLIFTHSGVIRAFYHLLHNIAYSKLFDLKIDFGSLHTFNIDPNILTIINH